MEFRLRASPEQFTIMLDFMETNGDLSKPQPGAQGRLRAERLWNELTEILNSVGCGVRKPTDKWKRVWSDWKTKTKKKASNINRDTHGTGGGPSRAKPLNPMEERILRIIGIGSITGSQEIQEAGFDVQPQAEVVVRTSSPSQHTQPASLPAEVQHPQPGTSQQFELPYITEPDVAEVANTAPTHTVPVSSNNRRQNTAVRSPSACPSTPRRRRVIGQRRRLRHQTPFELATSEFVQVEEARVRLEETRILRQHEVEMERLRVESRRIDMEESRNAIFQKIADTVELILQSQMAPRD